eukprot:TRINITY_DN800_c0_g1_i2.p1 TRINITY_DN800_c0_g1~~TRINITY_DN800_c0_g1_i2.p1  ORF type:complete len:214 (+),score=48.02 TRINITY_DN800_c0_g1_i2:15-656(+)
MGLSGRETYTLLKWLFTAIFWVLATVVLDCLPFLRPKKECPWNAADISPVWLTEKLRAGKHIDTNDTVKKIEVQGAVTGGLIGSVDRINVHYVSEPTNPNAPRTLIIKRNAPGFVGRLKSRLSCFLGELKFYEELRDSMPVPCPVFYYGQELFGVDVMIIMSDASPAAPGPDSTLITDETISMPLARRVTKNLAKIQAKFWNNKDVFSVRTVF